MTVMELTSRPIVSSASFCHNANVPFVRVWKRQLRLKKTSDEKFLPLKIQHADVQNHLFEVSL